MLGKAGCLKQSIGIQSKLLMIMVGWVLCSVALPAMAYIGPGAGVSFLGSLLSTLVVVVLAVGAILFWPVRYMWRRIRRQKNTVQQANDVVQDSD